MQPNLLHIPENGFYKQRIAKVNYTKKTLKAGKFENCVFLDISLLDCKLENCEFINCKFQNCVFSSCIPTDSTFIECQFKDTKLIGFDWTKAKQLRDLKFDSCQINYSNFSFVKLPKVVMVNCVAKEVVFTEADLSEAILSGTDFEGSRFFKTNLTKADFRNAENYLIDINSNIIKGAQFSFPQVLGLLKSQDITVDY